MTNRTALELVAILVFAIMFSALGLRTWWSETRLSDLENRAMPCYEDEALVWKNAPSEAQCVPLDDLLRQLLDKELTLVRP